MVSSRKSAGRGDASKTSVVEEADTALVVEELLKLGGRDHERGDGLFLRSEDAP